MSGQAGSGTWGYEGNATNSTLTLNNATITTSFNPTYANIKSSIPLTINLKGTNTITESEDNDAISLPRSGPEPTNTINGPGTLNLTGRTLISNGTGNNNLVINNTTITGKCTGNAIKAGNLTINNSTIRLDEYEVIVESEGGTLSQDKKMILDSNGNPAKKVVIKRQVGTTAIVKPSEGGTIQGPTELPYGEEITLTAVQNQGYKFVNWADETELIPVYLDPTYNFTVDSDHTICANFKKTTSPMTITAEPSEGGTITGDDDLVVGEEATVTATPYKGYEFKNWTDGNGQVVSTDPA